MDYKTIAAFAFGIIFVVVMLVFAVRFPRPTSQQYFVFRVVLALAAAGVAAMVPGFISLKIDPGKALLIEAGGAIAVFVIIYFFNPAQIVIEKESRLLSTGANALQALTDLDNAVREAVGPLRHFDPKKWLSERREKAIDELEKLANTQKILPKVRESIATLRQLRNSESTEETNFADIVLECGEGTLKELGPSWETPFKGPAQLATLVDLLRNAKTAEASTNVKLEAEKVYSIVNRDLLRRAAEELGRLRGSR